MEETRTTEKKIEVTQYSKKCRYCGTEVISMYEKQLAFNIGVHESICDENPVIKKRRELLENSK